MWLLILITLLNSLASNALVLEYRFDIAGVPINVFDLFFVVGLLSLLFRSERHFQTDRPHPALFWILFVFAIATIVGCVGGFLNGVPRYYFLNVLRNFISLPITIALGYGLLPNLRSAGRFLFVQIIAGVLTAGLILTYFSKHLDPGNVDHDINLLRTVDYISSYAGIAGVFLLGTVLCGIRVMPVPSALCLGLVAIGGQFSTISRSEWVSSLCALGAVFLLVPREKRIGRGLIVAASFVALVFLLVGSAVSLSVATHSDLGDKLEAKVVSLIPGFGDDGSHKAWDTRVPGIVRELEIWSEHPVFGGGFGIQVVEEIAVGHHMGFYHNVWSSTLAHAGIPGFLAMALTVGSCIVVGRRMVRDGIDQNAVAFGALGFLAGVFFVVYGMSTLSFNTQLGAIPLGLICGMTLRCRAIQLTMARQYAGYEADPWQEQLDEWSEGAGHDGVASPSLPLSDERW